MKKFKGFTLIEILVVIAIISILAVVVFVALNPAQRFTDARNARRTTDVNSILTAFHQCIVDEKGMVTNCGLLDGAMSEVELGACANAPSCAGVTACLDAGAALAEYIKSLPVDPQVTVAGQTGYTLSKDTNNMLTITACKAEGTTIEASR